MLDRIGRGWRVCATGLSFALFGVGGLLLRVVVFPLLALCVTDTAARVRAARATVRLSFRAFVGIMRGLGVLRYELRGIDKLDREGQLILANHPTLIDTVMMRDTGTRATYTTSWPSSTETDDDSFTSATSASRCDSATSGSDSDDRYAYPSSSTRAVSEKNRPSLRT